MAEISLLPLKKHTVEIEKVQGKATGMIKCVEKLLEKEQLSRLVFFCLKKRQLKTE